MNASPAKVAGLFKICCTNCGREYKAESLPFAMKGYSGLWVKIPDNVTCMRWILNCPGCEPVSQHFERGFSMGD
jgi:hypothetical protein